VKKEEKEIAKEEKMKLLELELTNVDEDLT